MTDLAREIETLLPCQGADYGETCEAEKCLPCHVCSVRPAILAYVQRKLDEAKAEGANEERSLHWQEIVGHADGDLLAKAEKLLSDDFGIRLDICAGGVFARQLQVHGLETRARAIAPTLVEALRKLVESES